MAVLVVKIGTSSLVGPDGVLRDEVLRARVAEIVRVRRQGHRPVLVTSGAIACGLGRLGITERPTALPDLQAASAVGQGVLFQRYLEVFGDHGIVPAQVLLTSADLERRASYLNARATLSRLLDLGVVPVVNENDTTATDELTFGDNDVLAAHVAVLLRATWLVLLTDRDGLYVRGADGGPELLGDVPAGVSPEDVDLYTMPNSTTGRGGIASKIASASMATAAGVTCVIASGARDGVVSGVAHGRHVGTRFQPAPGTASAFKLWLTYAKPAMGRVHVDAGAARALRMLGTSLLPVGVTGCDGAFAAGDAVEVAENGGGIVGKGIATLSADELRQVAGLKSAEVRRLLPDAQDEVVHRDQFVLLPGDAA
ncbi:MAG: glutamate 5-kinase [Actinomycetota bacterium]